MGFLDMIIGKGTELIASALVIVAVVLIGLKFLKELWGAKSK